MTREEAKAKLEDIAKNMLWGCGEYSEALEMAIKALEQEPQTFTWCTDCKEYDQEKHCCHRWSKVIRNTVEEMKQEQEPILDKIRSEIKSLKRFEIRGEVTPLVNVDRVLEIIDKAESEVGRQWE